MHGRHGLSVEDIIRYSAEHGEYGPGDVETIVDGLLTQYRRREPATYERRLADGTVLEVRTSPMPTGGVAVTLSDVTGRALAAAALEEDTLQHARHLRQISDVAAAQIDGVRKSTRLNSSH